MLSYSYIYISIVETRTQSQLEQAKVRELFIVEAEEVKVITQAKPRDTVELGRKRRCTKPQTTGYTQPEQRKQKQSIAEAKAITGVTQEHPQNTPAGRRIYRCISVYLCFFLFAT